MAFSLAALTTELTTDPKSLGYAALRTAGNDQGLADLLNRQGASNETVTLHSMTAATFAQAIVETEWAGLTVQQCLYQVMLAVCGAFDPNNANVVAGVQAVYAAGTQTRANLGAALTRQGSRAEVLFGVTYTVTVEQIAQALGRG